MTNILEKTRKRINSGFTLVELMVTVSVTMVIMAVVLFNYSKFNDNLALSAGAQEVAIALRQAQVYGLSVRERGTGDFNSAYGVSFSLSDPSNYYVFADLPTVNGKYDSGSSCPSGSECVEKDILRNGVTIYQVCDAGLCYDSLSNQRSLEVTFIRPNVKALIKLVDTSGNVGSLLQTGKVVLRSPQGKTLTISIEKTGQISIQ